MTKKIKAVCSNWFWCCNDRNIENVCVGCGVGICKLCISEIENNYYCNDCFIKNIFKHIDKKFIDLMTKQVEIKGGVNKNGIQEKSKSKFGVYETI